MITLLIGGGAGPKLFDAIAEYADGWMPIGGSGLAEALARLRGRRRGAGTRPRQPCGWCPSARCPPRPSSEHYRELGVDEVVLRVPSGSADEMLAVLDAHAVYVDRIGAP